MKHLKSELLEKYQMAVNAAPPLSSRGVVDGYLSPSRLLREMQDDSWVEAWRARVGPATADRILHEAIERGTAMHAAIEAMLAGEPIPETPHTHFTRVCSIIEQIEPLLFEKMLYDNIFKITGRCDMVGWHDGCLSVIDFKTSRKPKTKNELYERGYVHQITLYAIMLRSMIGIWIGKGVIINVPDDYNECLPEKPQVFIFDLARHVRETLEMLHQHRKGVRKTIILKGNYDEDGES